MLGLVVLRTKAQNGFCPMCTKGCCMVLNRSNPFWGQFWGQICETVSDLHRSNKCADLVSLRNADTSLTGFSRRKSPTSQYISFILWQEVVRKSHATASPYTAPVTAGNASVWAYSHSIGAVPIQSNTALKSPLFGDFLFYHKGIYLSSVKGTALAVPQFVKEYFPKSLRNREGFWYNRRKPPREAPSWKSTPKTPAAKQWLLT